MLINAIKSHHTYSTNSKSYSLQPNPHPYPLPRRLLTNYCYYYGNKHRSKDKIEFHNKHKAMIQCLKVNKQQIAMNLKD